MALNKIDERQNEIISNFGILEDNTELKLDYLMELGDALKGLSNEEKNEDDLIKGCQSKVWITAKFDGKIIEFNGDSNASITKGLVALLIKVYNQTTPQEILDNTPYFTEKIGMNRFIGTQRSNGFISMMQQFKRYAIAFDSKTVT